MQLEVGVSRTNLSAGGPDEGPLGPDRSAGPDRSKLEILAFASSRKCSRHRLSAGNK